jgi:hypothetical protein
MKKAVDGDEQNPEKFLEEQYERLFPKIGRDFVSRDDFVNILREILEEIRQITLQPAALMQINLEDNSAAVQRALEYSSFLDRGYDGSRAYPDLIKLED